MLEGNLLLLLLPAVLDQGRELCAPAAAPPHFCHYIILYVPSTDKDTCHNSSSDRTLPQILYFLIRLSLKFSGYYDK